MSKRNVVRFWQCQRDQTHYHWNARHAFVILIYIFRDESSPSCPKMPPEGILSFHPQPHLVLLNKASALKIVRCCWNGFNYHKSSIKPPPPPGAPTTGRLFISGTFKGGLNREGGLFNLGKRITGNKKKRNRLESRFPSSCFGPEQWRFEWYKVFATLLFTCGTKSELPP